MIDYIEFDDEFAMVKPSPPPSFTLGRPLAETTIRSKFGVTVVAIKRPPGEGFTYATADTILSPGDTIIVSGKVRDAERFAEQT